MTAIDGCGGYVPHNRIDRSEIAHQNDSLAKGESAVPNRDENHVTMACESVMTALNRSNVGPQDLGAILIASTTDPFAEHGIAAHVANRIDAPASLRTGDFAGSTRAATDALIAGRDIVRSRDKPVLVAATDVLPAYPNTEEEAEAGAGAGAVILAPSAEAPSAILRGDGEATTGFVERHRKHGEAPIQGDDRFERRYGSQTAIETARNQVNGSPDYGMAVAPDARVGSNLWGDEVEHVTTRNAVGFAGPASFFLDLVHCLEETPPGANAMALCYGAGGADALAIETGSTGNAGLTVEEQIESKSYVTYAKHLEYRKSVNYQGVPNP